MKNIRSNKGTEVKKQLLVRKHTHRSYTNIMKSILFLCFFVVLVNENIRAQSNSRIVDKLALKCANGNTKSCEDLKTIAINDQSIQVRILAVQKITDQNILAEIIFKKNAESVFNAIIAKLSNEDLLYKIALNHQSYEICLKAIERISNQDRLANIVLRMDTRSIGTTAIKQISDQNILAELANNDTLHYLTRVAAVARITDQDILIGLAKSNTEMYVQKQAVKKISDQNILIEIAMTDKHPAREEAIRKVTDQNILVEIAKHNKSNYLGEAAIRKITNQNFLCEIANDIDTRYETLIVIANKITDQNILAEFVKKNRRGEVQLVALKKITDQKILIDLIPKTTGVALDYAIKNISDQSDIISFTKNYHFFIREAAVKRIFNDSLLNDIVKNDDYYGVRVAAVKNIKDQNILADYAKSDINFRTRYIAVGKILDPNILIDIAKNGKYQEIQCLALNRLNEQLYNEQIIEIINLNIDTKHNLAVIGALKIIPIDKILKNNNEVIKLIVIIDYDRQVYTYGGEIIRFMYNIEVNVNGVSKSFYYEGKEGESKVSFAEFGSINLGSINIIEICEFLLSKINKTDLLKISEESDVYYLRETAKSMLQN